MKRLAVVLGLLFYLQLAAEAHADTTYNFYLTSTIYGNTGTGSFSINTRPPSTPGLVTFYVPAGYPQEHGTPGDVLTYIDFTLPPNALLEPVIADLGTVGGLTYVGVQFTGNTVTEIDFAYSSGFRSLGFPTVRLAGLQYTYSVFNFNASPVPNYETDQGVISFTDPIATTPEPSTLALLSTGLATGIAFARRRHA